MFSQNIVYTREFESIRSSVPLHIINNHSGYFFVLRYNKRVHDLTIERRSKPEGKILAFTPLKLDSVNANWFDYELLDYQIMEIGSTLYFVFEKVLNTRRTIYLKTVDTLGKTSGFRELAVLDKDPGTSDFRFVVKPTLQHKLLIVSEQYYNNTSCRKTATLYDPEKNEKIWVRKLPPENEYTGFSGTFACNAKNDLYYVVNTSRIFGYKRKYENHIQANVPVLTYDSISLHCWPNDGRMIYRARITLRDSTGKKNISVFPSDSDVTVVLHGYEQSELSHNEVFFLMRKFSANLDRSMSFSIDTLKEELEKKLTFYDATDHKEPWDKDYEIEARLSNGNYAYIVAGRKEENYYKEMLLLKTDLIKGKIVDQKIIPRKIFYFEDRTRYRSIGEAAFALLDETFYAFLIEDDGNRARPPEAFNFHKFSRQKSLWGSNLAAYILKPDGSFQKKIIHRNLTFEFVPLKYQGDQGDIVFFLVRGKKEKFAILNLSQL